MNFLHDIYLIVPVDKAGWYCVQEMLSFYPIDTLYQ